MPKLVLLWMAAAFLAGIITAGVTVISAHWLTALLFSILFLLISFIKRKKSSRIFFLTVLLVSFFCGSVRYQVYSEQSAPSALAGSLIGEHHIFQMRVIEPTLESIDYGETVLDIQSVLDSSGTWLPVQGKVKVRLPASFQFTYHTSLEIEGFLISTTTEGEKAHASWLKREGVDFQMYYPTILEESVEQGFSCMGALYDLRQRAYQVLQSIIPFPESELLAGILLGLEGRIPDYLSEAFRLTGTAHIVAISGFNIALISAIISKIFCRIFPYRIGAAFSILAVGIYTIFVGAQPPVVRAAIMGVISIPAYLIGRKIIGIHVLSITAACMALINPFILWDVSFQLSIFATFGILMYADFFMQKVSAALEKSQIPSKEFILNIINDFVITTFSAQLATFPILASQFQEYSLLSPLVNLLILPLQPAIMLLGGAALICGLLFYPFGRFVGLFAWLIAAFNDKVVLFFSLFPSELEIDPRLGFWISMALNLLIVFVVLRQKKRSLAPEPG